MRIGIDARPLSYPLTGIGTYLKHLLDVLQKTDKDNHYYLISNTLIPCRIRNHRWCKIEGSIKNKIFSTIWMQTFAPILVKRHKIDLFFSPRHHLPLMLPKKIKSIVTIHDLIHIRYPETMDKFRLIAERALMRPSLRKADKIIAVSRTTADDIRDCYDVEPDKIHIIHHGVPDLIQGVSKNDRDPTKYFLFIGTLEPRKNLDRIITAFQHISDLYPEIHLVVVGEIGERGPNYGFSKKVNTIENKIHFHGYVAADQLADIYKNALCLLYPSLYEGFGLPILEAMSMGTPVITSKESSMPEVAGEAALLVDPKNIDSISNAMNLIISNSERRNELIQKGYMRIKQFTWKRCAYMTRKVMMEAVSH